MKKTIILLIVIFIKTTAFSQKKKSSQLPITIGTSEILRTDKWIENFSIKKEKFNVYCGYQKRVCNLEEDKIDTLIVYKIAFDKAKYSQLEITKLAVENGKIISEGYYMIKNDTLKVVMNYYNYIEASRITDIYVLDKYRFLKKISDKMEAIENEKLSNKYRKPLRVNVPLSPSTK
nr:hypothetical protein [Flavobacterium sp. ASV13]